jgi:hypothetical protein
VTIHPQVPCLDFQCDEELRVLLTCMNRLGIRTRNSCQDNKGLRGSRVRRVWVEVEMAHLTGFLSELERYDELEDWQSLSCRMATDKVYGDHARYWRDLAWHYDMHVWRRGGVIRPLAVSIRFPYTDLQEVTRRLEVALTAISQECP